MKKRMFVLVLLAVMVSPLVACGPGSPIQSNTPVPNANGVTPVPNNQINVPGVSIQIHAPSPNPLVNTPDSQGNVEGILMGLWHGFISPVTLIVSFFNKNITIYDVHNNGNQYNLGFMLGVILLLGIIFLMISRR